MVFSKLLQVSCLSSPKIKNSKRFLATGSSSIWKSVIDKTNFQIVGVNWRASYGRGTERSKQIKVYQRQIPLISRTTARYLERYELGVGVKVAATTLTEQHSSLKQSVDQNGKTPYFVSVQGQGTGKTFLCEALREKLMFTRENALILAITGQTTMEIRSPELRSIPSPRQLNAEQFAGVLRGKVLAGWIISRLIISLYGITKPKEIEDVRLIVSTIIKKHYSKGEESDSIYDFMCFAIEEVERLRKEEYGDQYKPVKLVVCIVDESMTFAETLANKMKFYFPEELKDKEIHEIMCDYDFTKVIRDGILRLNQQPQHQQQQSQSQEQQQTSSKTLIADLFMSGVDIATLNDTNNKIFPILIPTSTIFDIEDILVKFYKIDAALYPNDKVSKKYESMSDIDKKKIAFLINFICGLPWLIEYSEKYIKYLIESYNSEKGLQLDEYQKVFNVIVTAYKVYYNDNNVEKYLHKLDQKELEYVLSSVLVNDTIDVAAPDIMNFIKYGILHGQLDTIFENNAKNNKYSSLFVPSFTTPALHLLSTIEPTSVKLSTFMKYTKKIFDEMNDIQSNSTAIMDTWLTQSLRDIILLRLSAVDTANKLYNIMRLLFGTSKIEQLLSESLKKLSLDSIIQPSNWNISSNIDDIVSKVDLPLYNSYNPTEFWHVLNEVKVSKEKPIVILTAHSDEVFDILVKVYIENDDKDSNKPLYITIKTKALKEKYSTIINKSKLKDHLKQCSKAVRIFNNNENNTNNNSSSSCYHIPFVVSNKEIEVMKQGEVLLKDNDASSLKIVDTSDENNNNNKNSNKNNNQLVVESSSSDHLIVYNNSNNNQGEVICVLGSQNTKSILGPFGQIHSLLFQHNSNKDNE